MKKIPLLLKILIPISLIAAAAFVFFLVKYAGENKLYTETMNEVNAILSEEPEMKSTDYKKSKKFHDFGKSKYENTQYYYDYLENEGTYEYEGIEFISFSEEWDSSKLEDLCDELFENTHGDEIYDLDAVAVYSGRSGYYPQIVYSSYDEPYIPIKLYEMLPNDFEVETWIERNILNVWRADEFTTAEQIAIMLSHSYGYYFMSTYFTIYGENEAIENDPYFKLRNGKDYNLYYKYGDYINWDDYVAYENWFLIEIAADDYVYLMGSPNTKKVKEFIDTSDQLRLSVKNKDDELNEYLNSYYELNLNNSPHKNVKLPLPDQIDGLPELLYEAIDKKAPDYKDRTNEAKSINIVVKKRTHHGEKYYDATWNKPWDDKDVTYTLVAYNKDDELLGAIKSVNSDERARAIFGGAVVETSSTSITYYEEDYWSKQGFIRLRVIVTFDDGTCVISPAVDWSFE